MWAVKVSHGSEVRYVPLLLEYRIIVCCFPSNPWTASVVFRSLHVSSQVPSSVVCFASLLLRRGGACKERSGEHQQGAVHWEGRGEAQGGAAPAFGIHAVTAAQWTAV